MKVALLTFNNGELSIQLASSLAQKADVTLLLPQKQLDGVLCQLSPDVALQPYKIPRLRQPLKQLRFVYKLWKQIRKIDPDVLHIQASHLWFTFALPFLRKYPLVVTVHDPRDHIGDVDSRKTPQWIKDFSYRQSQQIIVHASQMKSMVVDSIGIPSEKISVVPLVQFGNSELAKDVPEEKNTVLFFGRIWEYKGLEYLIRAEPLITAQIPDAKIVIAGKGDDFEKYRQLMTNPDNFIVHNERVSSECQATLFRQASLVAMPYIEATQSGVIPVAYNFEKPVVATKVGALHEQVDDGKTGYLVEPRNVEQLAEKIIYLLQNEELRRQMGANGKHKKETEWSTQVAARKTLAAYQRAMANKKKIHTALSAQPKFDS